MSGTNARPDRPRGSKRRNLIVSPSFQWKYTSLIAASVFVMSNIMSISLYGYLYEQARNRTVMLGTATQSETALSLLVVSLLFATIPAAAFGIWSMILTRRICGPIAVMQNQLSDLADGRFPNPRELRKRDEFKAFFGLLGRTVDSLKQRKQTDLKELSEIEKIATSAVNSDSRGWEKALRDVASRSNRLCAEAATSLGLEQDGVPDSCEKTTEETRRQLETSAV